MMCSCDCHQFVLWQSCRRCGKPTPILRHRVGMPVHHSVREARWRDCTPDFRFIQSVVPAPKKDAPVRHLKSLGRTDAGIMGAVVCCSFAPARPWQRHGHDPSWQSVFGISKRRIEYAFDVI